MNHLRPLTSQPPSTFVAAVVSIDGSAPAPGAGSVMAKADLASPRHERSEVARALRVRRHVVEQVDVALVGCVDVERHRAEQRAARSLEDRCPLGHAQAETAAVDRTVRRQQPLVPCAGLEASAQGLTARCLDVSVVLVLDGEYLASYVRRGRRDDGGDVETILHCSSFRRARLEPHQGLADGPALQHVGQSLRGRGQSFVDRLRTHQVAVAEPLTHLGLHLRQPV